MSDYKFHNNNQNNTSDDDDEIVMEIPIYTTTTKTKETSSKKVSDKKDKQAPTYETNFLLQQQIKEEIDRENQEVEEELELDI